MSELGPIRAYYADLVSGAIQPEDVRIESLTFRVEVDALGAIFDQTKPVGIISRYNFVLRKVAAWMAHPADAGFALGRASFNVQEQGRGFSVFKFSQFLGGYVGTSGSCGAREWDACFISVPGATLELVASIDTAQWVAQVGAYKMFGVDLIGDYVACGEPRAPAGG